MKVLHLNAEHTWRGGEQQLAYLMDQQRAAGLHLHVACPSGSALAQHCQAHGIPCTTLRFRGSFDLATHKRLKELISTQKFSLLHTHTGKAHAQAVLAHRFGKHRPPIIHHRRIDKALSTNTFSRWKMNYAGVARIITVSDAVRRVVQGHLKHTHKVVTIYDGIDPERFRTPGPHTWLRHRYSIARHTPLIGNTAALDGHKDYFTFLDTAAELTRQGLQAHYIIMGEGHLRPQLEAYARQLPLQGRLTFTGFLSNLGEVLPELDVFLMTSQEEGLGSSVLDAFAARVPVVATRAGGIPEMIRSEEHGLLADVKDVPQLARHVRRILGDSDLAGQLRHHAHQRLHEQFTTHVMAQKTIKLYREVV